MVEQVGRYKIKGQLGRGAMGVVYLADDPLLNRQAAIKTVDLGMEDAGQREFLRTRLLRDARAAAGLSHPNIVAVFDVVEAGDSAYLVMEYVAGETLAAALDRNAAPDPAFGVRVLRDMAAALDYTHARGIVHRDIKPANVMIDTSGAAKIMDFGIARIADTRTMTPTGMVMGTIEYMSPEQVKGEAVDGRSDQFALAAVAYRMLTGATVFGQHTLATLAYKIVHEAAPLVRMRNAALPASVDAVVSKGLAKLPQDRYGTCGEFVAALAGALAQPAREETTLPMPLPHGVAPAPATVPMPAPAPAGKSHAALIAAAAVLVLAAGGLAVWQPWKKPVEPRSAPQTTAQSAPPAQPPATQATAPQPVESKAANPVASTQPPPKQQPPPKKAESQKEIPLAEVPEEVPPSMDNAMPEPVPAQTPQPAMDAYKQGMQLLNGQQFGPAIQSFTKAMAIRPDWPNPLLDRGRAYLRQGDCMAAIRDFDQFIRARPKNAPAYTYRGQCYVRLKDDNQALDNFNSAIALKPNALVALYARALLHMRRNAFAAAVNDFNEAIRESPNYEAAYLGRGNAKLKMGDRAGAQADFKIAHDLKAK